MNSFPAFICSRSYWHPTLQSYDESHYKCLYSVRSDCKSDRAKNPAERKIRPSEKSDRAEKKRNSRPPHGERLFFGAGHLRPNHAVPGYILWLSWCCQMSGMPFCSHSSRMSSGQMLAWISPMCPLWSRTMHRRLWPMPPPMLSGSLSDSSCWWK